MPSERAAGAESRALWQAHHDEVRRRHLAGGTLLGISRKTGLALGAVRKYARAESFPARTLYGPGPSILDPYLSHLERRLAEGLRKRLCSMARAVGAGFLGRHPAGASLATARTGPHARCNKEVGEVPPLGPRSPVPALPTVPQLAWLLVQPTTSLGVSEVAMAARVEQDEQAAAVVQLARQFTALVRACGVASRRGGHAPADPATKRDAWLVKARACRAPAIMRCIAYAYLRLAGQPGRGRGKRTRKPGPPPSPSLPAVRRAIMDRLFAQLTPPIRCPCCHHRFRPSDPKMTNWG